MLGLGCALLDGREAVPAAVVRGHLLDDCIFGVAGGDFEAFRGAQGFPHDWGFGLGLFVVSVDAAECRCVDGHDAVECTGGGEAEAEIRSQGVRRGS